MNQFYSVRFAFLINLRKYKNRFKKTVLMISAARMCLVGTWGDHRGIKTNYISNELPEKVNYSPSWINRKGSGKSEISSLQLFSLGRVYGYGFVVLEEKYKINTDICKWGQCHPGIDSNIRWAHYIKASISRFFGWKPLVIENAALISPHCYGNYYHFIVDVLLRLEGYEKYSELGGGRLSYVATAPLSPFHREYFKLLNISVIETKAFYARKFVVSGARRYGFLHSRNAIQYLKERLLDNFEADQLKPDKLVYISREKANQRRVENEIELFDELLMAKGFKTYRLEEMSVAEQITLFASARIVVSPHGAGLVNIIYMNKPNLIELLPYDNTSWGHFENLSYTLGGTYSSLYSNGSADSEKFKIDINKLKSTLETTEY